MQRIGIQAQRPSWSRMAQVYDRIQPLGRADEYSSVHSRAFTPKPVAGFEDSTMNLAERVEFALQQELSSPGSLKDAKDAAKGTSSFAAVSREQLSRRLRSETPPLGTYSPQFDVILNKSPRIIFSRARLEQHPQGRVETEGDLCKKRNKSLAEAEHTPHYPGIPFIKQTDRPRFVDPRKGPNEKRFLVLKDTRVGPKRVRAFAAYSPRRELFRLPTYLSTTSCLEDEDS